MGIAWYITFGRHILHANRKSRALNMNSSGLGARLGYTRLVMGPPAQFSLRGSESAGSDIPVDTAQ